MMLVTDVGLAGPYDKQRELFVAAESALNSGKQATFRDLKRELTDYPLYGYLEYWQLRRRLGKAGAGEVQAFLDQYQEQPIATRLRISWLHQLGKRRDWNNYLRFYRPQRSVTLQCYDVRARLSKGDREQALQDALELWLVGYSQPDACDPAFDQLYASSRITSEQIWARIRLAFANQKSSLAGYLAKRLSAEDREWVKRWQYAHRRPTDALSKSWSKQDTPLVREILTHACLRLARHKPEQAWKHWQEIAKSHPDKLIIGVPALVGGVPIMLNILPALSVLLLVVGAYLHALLGAGRCADADGGPRSDDHVDSRGGAPAGRAVQATAGLG